MADDSSDRAVFTIRIEDDSSGEGGGGAGGGGGGGGGGGKAESSGTRARQKDSQDRTSAEIRNAAVMMAMAQTQNSMLGRIASVGMQISAMRRGGGGIFGGGIDANNPVQGVVYEERLTAPTNNPSLHWQKTMDPNNPNAGKPNRAGANAVELGGLLQIAQIVNDMAGGVTQIGGDIVRGIPRSMDQFVNAMTKANSQSFFDMADSAKGGIGGLYNTLRNVVPMPDLNPFFLFGDAVGLAAESAFDFVKAIRKGVLFFEGQALELQKYNFNLQGAVARSEIAAFRNTVYESQALGNPLGRIIDAQTRIDNSMSQIWVPIKRLFLEQMAPVMERLAGFLEKNSGSGVAIEEIGKQLIDNIVNMRPFWMGFKDMDKKIAKAQADEKAKREAMELPIDQFFRGMEAEVNRLLRPEALNEQWGNRIGEAAQPVGRPNFPLFRNL